MALVKFEKWEGMESDMTIMCSQRAQVFCLTVDSLQLGEICQPRI